MALLAEPYAYMDLGDGGSKTMTILRIERGEGLLHPRDGRGPFTAPVWRLHVPIEDKGLFPPYWDTSSKNLGTELEQIFRVSLLGPMRVKITKIGEGAGARFRVEKIAGSPLPAQGL